MGRKQRTFTEQEADIIKGFYIGGIGIKAIAKELHVDDKKISQFLKDHYGPNYLHVGRKKENPSEPTMECIKTTMEPPVGKEWKPWMIPTDIILPDDPKDIHWPSYAEDYDRRKKICDERNDKLARIHQREEAYKKEIE